MFWLSKRKEKLSPLEYMILLVLKDQPMHGYDIMHCLNDIMGDLWEAKSGTIYPILSKMKDRDLLEEETVKSPAGPSKKMHSLTAKGETLLDTTLRQNLTAETVFMRKYAELTGKVVDNSEYRDILFNFLDWFTSARVKAVEEIADPKARGVFLDRLARLFKFFHEEVEAERDRPKPG